MRVLAVLILCGMILGCGEVEVPAPAPEAVHLEPIQCDRVDKGVLLMRDYLEYSQAMLSEEYTELFDEWSAESDQWAKQDIMYSIRIVGALYSQGVQIEQFLKHLEMYIELQKESPLPSTTLYDLECQELEEEPQAD